MNRIVAASVLAAGLALCPGCSIVRWVGYVFAPVAEQRTVEAEYKGLENQTVAVVVFAGREILCDYPSVRLDLGNKIAYQLEQNVKGIKLVQARVIDSYQEQHQQWEATPRAQLAKDLNADRVLLVSLIEYQTRLPGSTDIFLGCILGEAAVFSNDPSQTQPLWRTARTISVSFPKESQVGVTQLPEATVRHEVEKLFALELGRKFYKHKINELQESGK